jgi:hypothetical protein
MPIPYRKDPASYRDPSGFVFTLNGQAYRQVNKIFSEHFDHFISSGCYQSLVNKKLLISHAEIKENLSGSADHHATLKPVLIETISYPWEWTFSMLKDAALLTLQVMKEALSFNMTLKDASAYNIQFLEGRLVFIDTLSFEKYLETEPCEHFLGPLLLMHHKNLPLTQLFVAYPDGIPLQVTQKLLPKSTRFSLHTYLHIHLHAKVSATAKKPSGTANFSKRKLLNLLLSLELLVKKLKTPPADSTWTNYYPEAETRADYLQEKKTIVSRWLDEIGTVHSALDLGANKGEFSKLVTAKNIHCVATDQDPFCIDEVYRAECGSNKYLVPLVLDLSHPSPSLGVNNTERASAPERLKSDLVLALALIHHLSIGRNIPLPMVSQILNSYCREWLITEFVPKEDLKVKEMLQQKRDIYAEYNPENFEKALKENFTIIKTEKVGRSGRSLYLLRKLGK